MSEKYLFGNWKMYLNYEKSLALAQTVASRSSEFSGVVLGLFPSAVAFTDVTKILQQSDLVTGAQNAHWVEEGGYTGEVSMAMYRELGARYVLIGHSERRHLFHETNHEVRQKVEAALAVGLTPVICVGETEKEHAENQTALVIETQIKSAFHNIVWPEGRGLIVAYEPVWAIGSGQACDPIEVEKIHELIKKQLATLLPNKPVILYGGSVKADNVGAYINNPTIDGVLVGGGSANIDSLVAIASAMAQ